jgi:hypothetical protein
MRYPLIRSELMRMYRTDHPLDLHIDTRQDLPSKVSIQKFLVTLIIRHPKRYKGVVWIGGHAITSGQLQVVRSRIEDAVACAEGI